MKEAAAGLGHLLVFAFLFCVGAFMVAPVIVDVTMAALCPGQDQCSLAIYLTGLQQALGLLATLSIVPLAILAFNQTMPYFYAYYVAKTLTAMVSEGAMMCLSLAYVVSRSPLFSTSRAHLDSCVDDHGLDCSSCNVQADKVPEAQRAAAFGVFSGVCIAGFVAGTIVARFLYVLGGNVLGGCCGGVHEGLRPGDGPRGVADARRGGPPSPLRSFLQCRGVVAEAPASAEGALSVVNGGPSYKQVHAFLNFQGFLYSIAWSFWVCNRSHDSTVNDVHLFGTSHAKFDILLKVPYLAASCVILSILVGPCIRSIVSKKVGPSEQGMVQGCITGISSTASVISPLVFTPLTAWFLSETAPFNFKGFSLACAGFAMLVALIMSINMRPAEVQPDNK
ncbi:hypothetical protein ACQ4PT_061517 [Festuca glaucescens]